MQEQFSYKIVLELLFEDGTESYIIWEPMMYGELIDRKVDIHKLFYSSPELVAVPPLEVNVFLYMNPSIQKVSHRIEDNEVEREVLVGKKVLHLHSY